MAGGWRRRRTRRSMRLPCGKAALIARAQRKAESDHGEKPQKACAVCPPHARYVPLHATHSVAAEPHGIFLPRGVRPCYGRAALRQSFAHRWPEILDAVAEVYAEALETRGPHGGTGQALQPASLAG